MKLSYRDTAIEVSDEAIDGLKNFGVEVAEKLQAADPDYADYWTRLFIYFDEIQPIMVWGSDDDFSDDALILVRDIGRLKPMPYEIDDAALQAAESAIQDGWLANEKLQAELEAVVRDRDMLKGEVEKLQALAKGGEA